MNSMIHLKTITRLLTLTPTALLSFAIMPLAQAVNPPPDGGYPGFNTAEGQNALFSLTTGVGNAAVGWFSLFSNTDGSFNTAVGAGSLLFNVGDQNTDDGIGNTAIGAAALLFNTTGLLNTAIGTSALLNNTTGGGNIALGQNAGSNLTTGSLNIDIGNSGVAGESETIRIGTLGTHQATYIQGIAGTTVGAGGTPCFVDNDGKLGVLLSARRFKTDIADMGAASEALLALRPVTFHYKPELDKKGIPQFGLVAEEVAQVNPDLVVRDSDGKPYTVRYEAVNAMLLNEFLKEHRKVEEQQATIAQLKKDFQTVSAQQHNEIRLLSAQLKEQAALIEKVSAQVKIGRSDAQVVKVP